MMVNYQGDKTDVTALIEYAQSLEQRLAQEQEHYRNQAAECLKEKHRADDLQKQLASIVEPAKMLLNEIASSGTHQTWKRLNNAVHALTDE